MKVEPIHQESQQYGTDVERISMPFGQFLDSLKSREGPHPYLTTQYTEEDPERQTFIPPPASALIDDFPMVPRLMGNLFLQQVNLWLGKSQDGSSSGLVRTQSSFHPGSELTHGIASRFPRQSVLPPPRSQTIRSIPSSRDQKPMPLRKAGYPSSQWSHIIQRWTCAIRRPSYSCSSAHSDQGHRTKTREPAKRKGEE